MTVEELQKAKDAAVREMEACHKCWDDFTAKVSAVLPSFKNTPLFQGAEELVEIVLHRNALSTSFVEVCDVKNMALKLLQDLRDRYFDEACHGCYPLGHGGYENERKRELMLAVDTFLQTNPLSTGE